MVARWAYALTHLRPPCLSPPSPPQEAVTSLGAAKLALEQATEGVEAPRAALAPVQRAGSEALVGAEGGEARAATATGAGGPSRKRSRARVPGPGEDWTILLTEEEKNDTEIWGANGMPNWGTAAKNKPEVVLRVLAELDVSLGQRTRDLKNPNEYLASWGIPGMSGSSAAGVAAQWKKDHPT